MALEATTTRAQSQTLQEMDLDRKISGVPNTVVIDVKEVIDDLEVDTPLDGPRIQVDCVETRSEGTGRLEKRKSYHHATTETICSSEASLIRESILHPVVEELQQLIEGDPELFMLFHQMFQEVPTNMPSGIYANTLECQIPKNCNHNCLPCRQHDFRRLLARTDHKTEGSDSPVHDYATLLAMINAVIMQAPPYNTQMLVGFPLMMCTNSGQAVFLNRKFNVQLMKILNVWAVFLDSAESANVLNEDPDYGWLGANALKYMPNFAETFEWDPSKPHWGFHSWNDFFTRQLRPEIRPVADPDDDRVIINACESYPYRLASGVKAIDRFWVKGQTYSLDHILARDPLTAQFHGGSVYQAFLSQFSYHRWHSPVSGRIVKAYIQPGSYFSQAPCVGFDELSPEGSQAYITAVATRAIIFIEAENPGIGLMCFLAVGIAEVSTCAIFVVEGQRVQKGQQLGMFRYGGSTYCLILRPQAKLSFDLHGRQVGMEGPDIPVNAQIAVLID